MLGMEATDLEPFTLPAAILGPSAVVHEYRKKAVDLFVGDNYDRFIQSALRNWQSTMNSFHAQQDLWLNGNGFGRVWHDGLFDILGEVR